MVKTRTADSRPACIHHIRDRALGSSDDRGPASSDEKPFSIDTDDGKESGGRSDEKEGREESRTEVDVVIS